MNALSINVQGFGEVEKRGWIRKLCQDHHINFLAVQETKMLQLDIGFVRQVWGNLHFDFVCSSARGRSEGILCVWNKFVFQKNIVFCMDNFVAVKGVWLPSTTPIMFISVYAPRL